MSLVNRMILNVYFFSGRTVPVDMFVRLGCCWLGCCWLGSWCWFDIVVLRIASVAYRSSLGFRSLV